MTEITLHDLITIRFLSIHIWLAVLGLNNDRSVFPIANVGIIKGVDVNGETSCMIREFLGVGHIPITETAGVIVFHLPFVVCIILISQANALNRVVVGIKLTEDGQQLIGYDLVAHQGALMRLLVIVPMQHFQISEVATLHMRIGMICLALHDGPYTVWDLLDRETVRKILALHTSGGAKPEQCYEGKFETLHQYTTFLLPWI
jgi:hypothetical protein